MLGIVKSTTANPLTKLIERTTFKHYYNSHKLVIFPKNKNREWRWTKRLSRTITLKHLGHADQQADLYTILAIIFAAITNHSHDPTYIRMQLYFNRNPKYPLVLNQQCAYMFHTHHQKNTQPPHIYLRPSPQNTSTAIDDTEQTLTA